MEAVVFGVAISTSSAYTHASCYIIHLELQQHNLPHVCTCLRMVRIALYVQVDMKGNRQQRNCCSELSPFGVTCTRIIVSYNNKTVTLPAVVVLPLHSCGEATPPASP